MANTISWKAQPFYHGRYLPSRSDRDFRQHQPGGQKPLSAASRSAIQQMSMTPCESLARGLGMGCWSGITPARRAETLMKLADLIVRDSAEMPVARIHLRWVNLFRLPWHDAGYNLHRPSLRSYAMLGRIRCWARALLCIRALSRSMSTNPVASSAPTHP